MRAIFKIAWYFKLRLAFMLLYTVLVYGLFSTGHNFWSGVCMGGLIVASVSFGIDLGLYYAEGMMIHVANQIRKLNEEVKDDE